MAPTGDLACHYLRATVRRIRMARETIDSSERLRHLQDGLALLHAARQLLDQLAVSAARSVAGVPHAVIPDDVTMVEIIVDAQDEMYGHG